MKARERLAFQASGVVTAGLTIRKIVGETRVARIIHQLRSDGREIPVDPRPIGENLSFHVFRAGQLIAHICTMTMNSITLGVLAAHSLKASWPYELTATMNSGSD